MASRARDPRSILQVPAPGDKGDISIIVIGADEVRALAPKYRELATREYERAVRASLALQYQTLIRKIPEYTGESLLAIKIRTPAEGEPMPSGEVVTDLDRAPSMEFGREPGHFPPVAPLEEWAKVKIGKAGLGFPIARAIARRGLPREGNPKSGLHAFEETWESTQDDVNRLFERAVDTVLRQL